MREVMFRGKPVCEYSEIDEEFKEDFKENIKDGFIYGYLIGKDVIVGEIVDWDQEYFATEFWCKVDPSTVGQFTGIRDKNGVEVYEGDIYKNNHGAIFEIIWDVETAGFAGKSSNGNLVTLYKPLSGEVIGTIHENPELLEAKNEQIS